MSVAPSVGIDVTPINTGDAGEIERAIGAFARFPNGSLIVATVMNLPNIGPLLLRALVNQDMYLAGSILLIYCFLTIIGTLISDVLLAWLDPRIRMES